MQTTALRRIRDQPEALWHRRIGHAAESEVRDGHIEFLSIGRGTPLAASEVTSLAGTHLPQHGALLVGVESVHHSRFLGDDQRSLLAVELDQHGRLAKVEVGPLRLRTIRELRRGAAVVESIVFGHLARPEQFTGLEIHGQDGIAGFRRWVRVVVACCDVQHSKLLVDGRRRPDSGAGRSVLLRPRGAFAGGLRRLGNREGLPEFLPCRGVQCDHAPSKRAALIARVRPQPFFE